MLCFFIAVNIWPYIWCKHNMQEIKVPRPSKYKESFTLVAWSLIVQIKIFIILYCRPRYWVEPCPPAWGYSKAAGAGFAQNHIRWGINKCQKLSQSWVPGHKEYIARHLGFKETELSHRNKPQMPLGQSTRLDTLTVCVASRLQGILQRISELYMNSLDSGHWSIVFESWIYLMPSEITKLFFFSQITCWLKSVFQLHELAHVIWVTKIGQQSNQLSRVDPE